MINEAQFRADFPEFASTTTFPSPAVTFWLALAGQMINTDRWGPSAADPWPGGDPPDRTPYDLGVELFIGHNLILEALASQSVAAGALPGLTNAGVIASKSVDKVSISYDSQAGIEKDAGHWNLTLYGRRFYRMLMNMGAGPLQF